MVKKKSKNISREIYYGRESYRDDYVYQTNEINTQGGPNNHFLPLSLEL